MKKRTAEEWQSLLDQQAASGLSAAAFCREQKLCPK
ncbi:IS66 family insertion sequence element accessory protein TnpA [Zooshikella harenae]